MQKRYCKWDHFDDDDDDDVNGEQLDGNRWSFFAVKGYVTLGIAWLSQIQLQDGTPLNRWLVLTACGLTQWDLWKTILLKKSKALIAKLLWVITVRHVLINTVIMDWICTHCSEKKKNQCLQINTLISFRNVDARLEHYQKCCETERLAPESSTLSRWPFVRRGGQSVTVCVCLVRTQKANE